MLAGPDGRSQHRRPVGRSGRAPGSRRAAAAPTRAGSAPPSSSGTRCPAGWPTPSRWVSGPCGRPAGSPAGPTPVTPSATRGGRSPRRPSGSSATPPGTASRRWPRWSPAPPRSTPCGRWAGSTPTCRPHVLAARLADLLGDRPPPADVGVTDDLDDGLAGGLRAEPTDCRRPGPGPDDPGRQPAPRVRGDAGRRPIRWPSPAVTSAVDWLGVAAVWTDPATAGCGWATGDHERPRTLGRPAGARYAYLQVDRGQPGRRSPRTSGSASGVHHGYLVPGPARASLVEHRRMRPGAGRRNDERTRFSFAKSDDDGSS